MRKVPLENLLLSENAVNEWYMYAAAEAVRLAREGIDPSSIPDEEAEILPDGSLRIFVKISFDKELSMVVPPGEWAWRMPEN